MNLFLKYEIRGYAYQTSQILHLPDRTPATAKTDTTTTTGVVGTTTVLMGTTTTGE